MLREAQDRKKYVKTIAVASGKDGMGKTNVTVNLAIALRKLGKNVMIVDADHGTGTIDTLLSVAPKYNILNLLNNGMSLKEVVVEGLHGIHILSAGAGGARELTSLDSLQRLKILDAFDAYDSDIDVLLIDTAAGISENAAFFCIAAQEIIIVTSPEPSAVADACALIKVLYTRYQEKDFHVLVNSATGTKEAFEVFRRLSHAAEEFLSISLDYLGYLPFDGSVPAAGGIVDIAKKFLKPADKVKGTLQFFIGSLLSTASDQSRENVDVFVLGRKSYAGM